MSESKIEWTDYTFNPWIGCTKVSPGCANCYAESQDGFRKWTAKGWGRGRPRKRTSVANWKGPRRWNAEAKASGERKRVFCASLADVFDEEVPDGWRDELFELVAECGDLDWLVLTKRPWKMLEYFGAAGGAGLSRLERGGCLSHVWCGVSVEDQERANARVPILLELPAAVRFLSVEPMLGPISIVEAGGFVEDGDGRPAWRSQREEPRGIDWVICGGESGPNARLFSLSWAVKLRAECRAAGAAFFLKQMGQNSTLAGVTGKGGDPAEWPEPMRVREWPVVGGGWR